MLLLVNCLSRRSSTVHVSLVSSDPMYLPLAAVLLEPTLCSNAKPVLSVIYMREWVQEARVAKIDRRKYVVDYCSFLLVSSGKGIYLSSCWCAQEQ